MCLFLATRAEFGSTAVDPDQGQRISEVPGAAAPLIAEVTTSPHTASSAADGEDVAISVDLESLYLRAPVTFTYSDVIVFLRFPFQMVARLYFICSKRGEMFFWNSAVRYFQAAHMAVCPFQISSLQRSEAYSELLRLNRYCSSILGLLKSR